MPNGNRQVDYVHLTNDPNFVKGRMAQHDAELLIKDFRGKEWIQFKDFAGHHIDTVRYVSNISLKDDVFDYPNPKEILIRKNRKMTEAEMSDKYSQYILDI